MEQLEENARTWPRCHLVAFFAVAFRLFAAARMAHLIPGRENKLVNEETSTVLDVLFVGRMEAKRTVYSILANAPWEGTGANKSDVPKVQQCWLIVGRENSPEPRRSFRPIHCVFASACTASATCCM